MTLHHGGDGDVSPNANGRPGAHDGGEPEQTIQPVERYVDGESEQAAAGMEEHFARLARGPIAVTVIQKIDAGFINEVVRNAGADGPHHADGDGAFRRSAIFHSGILAAPGHWQYVPRVLRVVRPEHQGDAQVPASEPDVV
jgi:hypothetical protein